MTRALALAVAALTLTSSPALSQVPTGGISGIVRDPSGRIFAGTVVTVVHGETGISRRLVASSDGRFLATFLAPGDYLVRAESPAFAARALTARVAAGMTTVLDVVVEATGVNEHVTVRAAPDVRHDHHEVGAWVNRSSIEDQPLNGRNVLELVKLEPGVPSPERLPGGRVFIAPLGAGLQTIPRIGFTRVTLDGGNIETPGTVATLLQISPDVVEQIHVATANFDIATGLATSGAVNVVTRSGSNVFHGAAFSTYRDRRWVALEVDPGRSTARDAAFRRNQTGGTLGGPVTRDRVFFFGGYERHDQRDQILLQPTDPALLPLAGVFVSPYRGTLVNVRVDVRATDRQRLFLRHSHDSNSLVGWSTGTPGPQLPSAWARRPVSAHQTIAAFTSVVTPTLVNHAQVSHFATSSAIVPVTAAECAPHCTGLAAPRIIVSDGASDVLVIGTSPTSRNAGYRLQMSEALVWQARAHGVQAGATWERTYYRLTSLDSDPVQMTLWAPGAVMAYDSAIALPSSFSTIDDIYRLPLRSFTTSVGAADLTSSQSPRRFDMLRLHVGDQWNLRRMSINAGVAWSYEPGVLNSDLRRPSWLAPLVGNASVAGPSIRSNLASSVGFVWQATDDGRLVVRGGVGRYFESIARTVALNLATERELLAPLGSGRLVASGANIVWNGQRLNFAQPSAFTGADLLAILPDVRQFVAGTTAAPNADFVNLDRTKEGRNLYDPSYTTPRTLHASFGVQRQFDDRFVVSVDVVWKRFEHTFINGIDYNRFFAAAGPVIPACTAAQRTDLSAVCSNGSIYFDTTSGRARYFGTLMQASRRFRGDSRVAVSYAYGSFVGNNGTGTGTTESTDGRVFGFSNRDWSLNYGPLPTDVRHLLNLSGTMALPWRVQLSLDAAAAGREPFSPYVGGMDFDGDGTTNDLLPGTRINEFNRGRGRADLVALVEEYNRDYAGRLTEGGQRAPTLTLPESFDFNDSFFTVDVRLSRPLNVSPGLRLTAYLEIFNVFDVRNYTGYGSNLASTATFGKPSGRMPLAFGSGGPRAAQVGARVAF